MTYLHLSKKPILKKNLKPIFGNQFETNKLFYNPKGLWFADNNCWIVNNNLSIETKYLYKLDISKLSIYKISKLSELDRFIKKYYNPNRNSIAETVDWKRVYNDYDGIMICPYLIKNKTLISIHHDLSFTDKTIVNDIILGNKNIIPKKFKPNIRTFLEKVKAGKIKEKIVNRLWYVGWEVSSGVIWKNYRKLKLTQI